MATSRTVGAAFILAALASCTTANTDHTSEPSDGTDGAAPAAVGDHLNLGYDEGSVCIPAPTAPTDRVIFGDTVLRHDTNGPVTISDVSLVNADHLTLQAAYLVEVGRGEMVIGFRHASDKRRLPKAWDRRVDARGATLRPGDARNLVLVVDAPKGEVATADAARIRHATSDGGQFVQDTLTQMATAQSCDGVLFDD